MFRPPANRVGMLERCLVSSIDFKAQAGTVLENGSPAVRGRSVPTE